jgi:signal transduction histidine kinase/CheY-like chemotaxis protein
MRDLPRPAQLYLFTVWIAAAVLLGWVVLQLPAYTDKLLLLPLWLVAYVLADYSVVQFEAGSGAVAMNVADTPLVFLIAVSGLPGALVVALGTAINDVLHRRQWSRSLFNSASKIIEYMAMLAVFTALHQPGRLPFSTPRGLLTFAAVAGVAYVLNTLLVGTIVALATRQSVPQVYREGFQAVRWIRFITLPLGALLAALWFVDPWLLILGVIPLILAQRAFAAVAGLHTESQRSQALAQEKTRLLDELQAQQAELVRSAKFAALGTFAAGIAHEFNNLMAAILGHAQLGLASPQVEEKDRSLGVAVRVCQRGRSITSSLLTFARRQETQRGVHQIQDAIEDTLALVEHELAKENIQIVREFRPVPPTLCDPGQIAQVVLNLISNARDALAARQGGLITLTLGQTDGQIDLTVSDTGSGIAAEMLDQIFQPFVTTKVPGKGTGLGMAICYGIIESHGGTIRVTSTVGQGTTVTVHLPIISAVPAPAQAPGPAESRLRILLVDDEPDVAEALARLLESHGHTVRIAADGSVALANYRAEGADVVLSDALMPGISGAQFVAALRAIDPDLPIIVITGQPGSAHVDAMLDAGAACIVGKPFVVGEVLAAIAQVRAVHR